MPDVWVIVIAVFGVGAMIVWETSRGVRDTNKLLAEIRDTLKELAKEA